VEQPAAGAPPPLSRNGRRRNQKASELVARAIASQIVDADLPEGTRLPRESEMLEILQVGRMTLREGLRLLETQGIIDIRSGPQGGPVVRKPKPDDLMGSLSLLLQFHGTTLLDVMLARRALEPRMAALAAVNITDEALDELGETVAHMAGDSGGHPDALFRQNERFHSVIAEASGNVVLWVFNETLKSMATGETFGVDYGPTEGRAICKAHRRILDAFRRRDPEAAEKAMADHLAEAHRYWLARYPELVSRPVRWIQL
jgi:GntR family transcriptional repressor for pyruvate dehydrogenase complex